MKKLLLSVTLALGMVVSLAGCSNTTGNETKDNTSVSGVFTGTSTGMQGPVTVEMTIEEGKITKVELTDVMRLLVFPMLLLSVFRLQIVEHQTFDLDTVTGATLCSNALMRAAEMASVQRRYGYSARLRRTLITRQPARRKRYPRTSSLSAAAERD